MPVLIDLFILQGQGRVVVRDPEYGLSRSGKGSVALCSMRYILPSQSMHIRHISNIGESLGLFRTNDGVLSTAACVSDPDLDIVHGEGNIVSRKLHRGVEDFPVRPSGRGDASPRPQSSKSLVQGHVLLPPFAQS